MIEIIASSIDDISKIEAAGADRIELVSALSEGGLTPSYALIGQSVKKCRLPINIMIRPHAKSFVYSEGDLAVMAEDIRIAGELGANGVVFGTLSADNDICQTALKKLLQQCRGLEITFHRAIDELCDLQEGIKILAKYPQITNVLTSGGKGTALENLSVINDMAKLSSHLRILAGSGLSLENIREVMAKTAVKDFHFGTAVRNDKSPFGEIDENKLNELVRIAKNIDSAD